MPHDSRLPGQPSTDDAEVVRVDRGGWLNGPCLSELPAGVMAANQPPSEPAHAGPLVLQTVLHVAELGAELPLWRVYQTSAGTWTGVRAATASTGPVTLTRLLLPILATAMRAAELGIVRREHPGWSIRRSESGDGWLATAGEPPTLYGATLGQLAERIAAYQLAG